MSGVLTHYESGNASRGALTSCATFVGRHRLIATAVVVATSLSVIAIVWWLPVAARHLSTSALAKVCPTCKLERGDFSLSILSPGKLVVSNVSVSGGYANATTFTLGLKKIALKINLLELFTSTVHSGVITVDSPTLSVFDAEGHSPNSNGGDNSTHSQAIVIDGIEIRNGSLTYKRRYKGTKATLLVNEISGNVEPFSSRDEKSRHIDAHIEGNVANGGIAVVDCNVDMGSATESVQATLKLKDYKLDALNTFFRPNAGVDLAGRILTATSISHVRGNAVTSEVDVTYKGLKITMLEHVDRSEIMAVLENVGASIDVRESNVDQPPLNRRKKLALAREAREPTIGFILRSLRDAALSIARN